jgi:hypothetical protein
MELTISEQKCLLLRARLLEKELSGLKKADLDGYPEMTQKLIIERIRINKNKIKILYITLMESVTDDEIDRAMYE